MSPRFKTLYHMLGEKHELGYVGICTVKTLTFKEVFHLHRAKNRNHMIFSVPCNTSTQKKAGSICRSGRRVTHELASAKFCCDYKETGKYFLSIQELRDYGNKALLEK